jgi:hypothetical protein
VVATGYSDDDSSEIPLPDGTDIRVQATCNGQTYYNDALTSGGAARVQMLSLPAQETCSSTAIGFTLPAAVSGAAYRILAL